MSLCWLAQFSFEPCDGCMDVIHLVRGQRITREGLDDRDPRILRLGCRHHHHGFDFAKTIRLEESDYPDSVHEWAVENNFYWQSLERGWVKAHDPVPALNTAPYDDV